MNSDMSKSNNVPLKGLLSKEFLSQFKTEDDVNCF